MDFESLINEHKDAVYRQMIRACGNREDAEDVLVEALLKAYRSLAQLRDAVAFRAWLAQIARRICWQLRDRESLMPLIQLSALEEQGRQISQDAPSVEQQVALQEMKSLLEAAVAKLPDDYRAVYELRELQEVSGAERRPAPRNFSQRDEIAIASRTKSGAAVPGRSLANSLRLGLAAALRNAG